MVAIDSTVVYIFAAAGILALAYLFYPSIKRFRDGKPKTKKPDKKKDKALKELKEIKEAAKPPENIPAPPPAPSSAMEQFAIPNTIAIELTRIKEGTNKRVTTRKGKVTLIPRFGGGKDMFFFYVGKYGYFIDPSKIIEVKTMTGRKKNKEVVSQKLVYDVFNMEPLDANGNLTWSEPLELLHRDSILDQYITVATFEGGFQITSGLAKSIIVIGILGVLIGLSVNGTVDLTPRTIIHWVP